MNADDDYNLGVNSQQQQQQEQQQNTSSRKRQEQQKISSRKRKRQEQQNKEQQRPTSIRRTGRYYNLLDTGRTSSQPTSRDIRFVRTRRGQQQPINIYNEGGNVNLYTHGVPPTILHLPPQARIVNHQAILSRIRNDRNAGRRVRFNEDLNIVYNPQDDTDEHLSYIPPQLDRNVGGDGDTNQENNNLNNPRQNKYNKH